jgi:hypothetical protein
MIAGNPQEKGKGEPFIEFQVTDFVFVHIIE